MNKYKNVQIHLFEPSFQNYHKLLQNHAHFLETGRFFPNNYAIGAEEEIQQFYHYIEQPSRSTFHRHLEIEKQYNIQPPQVFSVLTTTLDRYVERMRIKRINFLKIDTEGRELEVLYGAKNLLQKGAIDFIQFEYDGTFLDAKITLEQIFKYLTKYRYNIFQIQPGKLSYYSEFIPDLENYQYKVSQKEYLQ